MFFASAEKLLSSLSYEAHDLNYWDTEKKERTDLESSSRYLKTNNRTGFSFSSSLLIILKKYALELGILPIFQFFSKWKIFFFLFNFRSKTANISKTFHPVIKNQRHSISIEILHILLLNFQLIWCIIFFLWNSRPLNESFSGGFFSSEFCNHSRPRNLKTSEVPEKFIIETSQISLQ